MEIMVEALKSSFIFDLTGEEKVKFLEWLHKDYQDYIEFSALVESERKMWNHYYPRPAEAVGILSSRRSGDKTDE